MTAPEQGGGVLFGPFTDAAGDAETPGQAAHRRWHEVRFPDSTPEAIAKEWKILSNRATAAWEAAAIEWCTFGRAAAQERPAPARADEFARMKVKLSALVASMEDTVRPRPDDLYDSMSREFDDGAVHATAVNLRQLRAILDETALTAGETQPAPARRALLDIITEINQLDEPGPTADWIRLLAEYGLGERPHPDGTADDTQERPAADSSDDGDGPCMKAGCGHGLDDHSLDLERGDRLYCQRCECREYLSAAAMRETRAPQPAPDLGTAWRLLDEARAKLAVSEAERDSLRQQCDNLRNLLDDFTHAVIDLDARGAIVKAAHAVRKKAGMTVIDSFSKPGGQ